MISGVRKWAGPIWKKVWSCVRHFIKILWNNLKRLFINHGKWHHFPYCGIFFIGQICMKGFEEKSDNDGIRTSFIFKISDEFLDGELIWSPKDDKLGIHCLKIGYPHYGVFALFVIYFISFWSHNHELRVHFENMSLFWIMTNLEN